MVGTASAVAVPVIVTEVWLVGPDTLSDAVTVGGFVATSSAARGVVTALPALSVVTVEKSLAPSLRFCAVKDHNPVAAL